MVRKKNVFDLLFYVLILLIAFVCLFPMALVVVVSFSSELSVSNNGYSLFPDAWSLEAYRTMLTQSSALGRSYLVSIFVTVVGTVLALVTTAGAAYTLANPRVAIRNHLAMFFFFTTMFNGGIVPWYIICTQLGLRDNYWALIIPNMLFNCFNMFLVRNFMRGIPDSLMESAYIDGAGDLRICFQIYLPLCKPVLATVALFIATGYWNDWWNAIMLIDDSSMYPLQYFLFNIQSEIQMMRDLVYGAAGMTDQLPNETFKMATVLVTVGPIILLYPFLQRYFVQGMIVGSVKG